MAFPQNFLDELIARSDIVDVVGSYVQLTRKGANLFGLCPFHSEKTGSFSVSPDKQIYYCFGCKRGGGVVNFIMEEENLPFPDAVRFLARRAGMEVPEEDGDREAGRRRQRLLDLNRDAARFYHQVLQSPAGASVREYLARRQITRQTAVRFGMGASPDAWDALLLAMTQKGYSKSELLEAGLVVQNRSGGLYDKFRNRLMLPVIDTRGDVVAFGSRVLDTSEPKYMNSSETPVYSKRRVLYGLNLAKKTKRPNIILCEGNLDIVTLHQAGFDNAVASMGTALTVEQTRLLSRFTKELVLCYDNDNAGKIATERALQILNNSEFTVRVLQLPRRRTEDGQLVKQDADDFIKQDIRSARAEEGVLRLLMLDDSLFPSPPPLREEQFSSPLLGKACHLLWQMREAGRPPSLPALAGQFTPEEMAHITAVCQQPESAQNAPQALADYIRIIQTQAEKRTAAGSVDPLLAATEKYKNKKGTGGKQHG